MGSSRLVRQAVEGEPFIITLAGKPAVKVVAVDAPERSAHPRIGFLAGHISVPEDFDRMGSEYIERLFSEGQGDCS